eukprot:TRINITY_DN1268_c0_g3_i7.p2 TRINITY_DN1268_c0_g3~~TRINITY_DN1268_c0_g3_i7.p2  ORF type:complete len:191 (+),score=32.24 TRINITY_DN1268_c0_g3_i7:49-621(+)
MSTTQDKKELSSPSSGDSSTTISPKSVQNLSAKSKVKGKMTKREKRSKCEIRAVFYSEFDVDKGPQIVCQYPQNFLSDSKFDAVSEFVINNHPSIRNKLMTVTAVGYKIFGVPMCIENTKYNRNEYLFNVGFVFDEDADVEVYYRSTAVTYQHTATSPTLSLSFSLSLSSQGITLAHISHHSSHNLTPTN